MYGIVLSLLLSIVLLIPQVRDLFREGIVKPVYLTCLSFSLSYLFTALLIPLAHRLKIFDNPDERKLHKNPTPFLGGLGIYAGFSLAILWNFNFSWEMKGVLISSSLIFIVGFLDDIFNLSAKLRLVVQLAAASLLIAFGIRITFIPDIFGGFWLESFITIIWLLGITNSMNFLDGLDGLASGLSIIICFFISVFALRTGQGYLVYLCVALMGSTFGFFLHNFRWGASAKIYLGDGGSNFLGFFLASVALLGDWAENKIWNFILINCYCSTKYYF